MSTMPFSFAYMRPDEMITFAGSAVGNVDSAYQASWVCDGNPGRPFMASSINVCSLHVYGSSLTVSGLVVANHNIDAARLIAISAGIACSLAPGTLGPSGIPKNPWTTVSSAVAGGFTLAVSSNTVPVVIGEVYAGTLRTLPKHLRADSNSFEIDTYAIEPDAEFASVLGYDKGLESRQLSGWNWFTDAQFADIQAWYDSTHDGTRPTVIVPVSTDPTDAWVVKFLPLKYRKAGVMNEVHFEFREYARSRW